MTAALAAEMDEPMPGLLIFVLIFASVGFLFSAREFAEVNVLKPAFSAFPMPVPILIAIAFESVADYGWPVITLLGVGSAFAPDE